MASKGNAYSLVNDAFRAVHKKKYAGAAVMLEKVLAAGLRDPYVFFLLSVAYLYSDRFDRAEKTMDRLRLSWSDYVPFVQLQLFLDFKSASSFEQALSYYLNALERFPDDPFILKGRKVISYCDNFSDLQKEAKLSDFVYIPKTPKHLKKVKLFQDRPRSGRPDRVEVKSDVEPEKSEQKSRPRRGKKTGVKKILAAFVFIIIIIAAVVLVLQNYSSIKKYVTLKKLENSYSGVDRIDVTIRDYDLVEKINRKEVPEFYYSSKKMSDDFQKAKRLIKKERANDALLLLNRINNSNANFIVKEKVNFLIKFVIDLELRNYEEVPFEKIAKQSYLYRGFAVKWNGKISNLVIKKEKQYFTLLVDYREKDRFSGVAEVFCDDISSNVVNGAVVTVEGIYMSPIDKNRKAYVVARNVLLY